MALPIITNTSDITTTTADDATNLPPSTIYPCVGFTVDVRGPGFTTADITWTVFDSNDDPVPTSIVSGQNTIQATLVFDEDAVPGDYTILATETATPANRSTHAITLLAYPPITVGTPNQPYVGGQTQFNTAYPFPVVWAPAQVNSSTGLATWTTAGLKTVTAQAATGECISTFEYVVYADVAIEEYEEGSCIYVNSGQSLALTVTGGSGTYSFSITGQNSITGSGVIQAGMYAGEYSVTIIDNIAGIIKIIPLCIGSQTQFCVDVEASECVEDIADPCCEITVDCGETVTLKVPTFHLRVNGIKEEIRYSQYGAGTVGDNGYFKSGSTLTDAQANRINCDNDENLFEIVTSLDMSDVVNAPFGIGFSQYGTDSGVNSIDNAIVWFTLSGVRYVEMRREGVPVVGSRFAIAHGDIVSAGYKNGTFVLYINNLLKYELADVSCCGNQFLDISIEQANKSIGGTLAGLTWNIITVGSPGDIGSINESGVYASPSGGNFGLVQAEASVGNARFRVNIRNIRPTARYTSPNAFLYGKAVTVWVGPYIPNFNETIRLAKDGSPDAVQNTYKGKSMIDLGTLEGSANFQLTRDFQDFTNDLGQIYGTSITSESATLAASFLEVRDLNKMSVLLPDSNLFPKRNGVTEFSVGGSNCDVRELRVIMVIGNSGCNDQFDVLYLPRVQNKGNLGLEVGRKANGKYEMTLTALPDFTRPTGKQLFSLFQIDSCSGSTCDR